MPAYSLELIQNIIKSVADGNMTLEDAANMIFVLFKATPVK